MRLQHELYQLGEQPNAAPQDKFKEAFGESKVETSTRLKMLEDELKKLKLQFKQEEELRRKM